MGGANSRHRTTASRTADAPKGTSAGLEWAKHMGIIACLILMNGAIHSFITPYPLPIPNFLLPVPHSAALLAAIASPVFILVETRLDSSSAVVSCVHRMPIIKAVAYAALAALTYTQLPLVPGASMAAIAALAIAGNSISDALGARKSKNEPMIPS
ncbi:hypothetical protein HDU87_006335 [Geranomyces variabilis]|uniref:Uncharacterized protein n=1 Tax=Geranomyces variabilis TaxID=109894 RepID=A0AAD5TFI8_9FUNG|nr:hypothetical protein HDU87_006335 [Geranomyces variabilis]